MMKRIIFQILAAVLLLSGCSGGRGDTAPIHLSFEVSNPDVGRVIVVVGRMQNYTVELDETGCGSVDIEGYGYIFPDIIYNRLDSPLCKLFLRGGDDVTVRIDAQKAAVSSAKKTGFELVPEKAAEAAEYLTNFPPSAFKDVYNLPLDDFLGQIDRSVADAVDILEADAGRASDKEFLKVEKQRLDYSYAQQLFVYPMGQKMADPTWKPGEDWYKAILARFKERPELLGVEPYCDYMVFAAKEIASRDDAGNSNLAAARYIGKNIRNAALKDMLEKYLVIDYLRFNGLDGSEELVKVAEAFISDESVVAEIDAEIERLNPLNPGHLSPSFKGEDIMGEQYTVFSLRGKPSYIDVWATWCVPCRAELPFFKELAEKYGDEINFVGLSIDEDKAAWEQRVNQGDMPGLQLWIGNASSFQTSYRIEGIPRFILLDELGRIVDADAPRPTSGEVIVSKLESLK